VDGTALVGRAQEAYAARDWVTARRLFREAEAATVLSGEHLLMLSDCAWWLGDLREAMPVLARSYDALLAEGRAGRAVFAALNLAYTHALRGEEAQAGAWIGRAEQLVQHHPMVVPMPLNLAIARS
jgi:ATP/maltotriose-dependent transcriptional regulator MalT